MALDIEGVMNYGTVGLLQDAALAAAGPYEDINIFMAPAQTDGVARACAR